NFDRAHIREDVRGHVARYVMRERRKRPILVGAFDGNSKTPGVQRRAAFGTNVDIQFCVLGGGIAEGGNVASECHLHLTPGLLAKERHGNIRHLEARFVRLVLRMPDQLLSFLHAFLQASGIRRDVEGRRPIERDKFALLRPVRLRPRRRGDAGRKPNQYRAARRVECHSDSPNSLSETPTRTGQAGDKPAPVQLTELHPLSQGPQWDRILHWRGSSQGLAAMRDVISAYVGLGSIASDRYARRRRGMSASLRKRTNAQASR